MYYFSLLVIFGFGYLHLVSGCIERGGHNCWKEDNCCQPNGTTKDGKQLYARCRHWDWAMLDDDGKSKIDYKVPGNRNMCVHTTEKEYCHWADIGYKLRWEDECKWTTDCAIGLYCEWFLRAYRCHRTDIGERKVKQFFKAKGYFKKCRDAEYWD